MVDSLSGVTITVLTNQDSIGNNRLLFSLIKALHNVTLQMPSTAVNETIVGNAVSLYPNPAVTTLHINSNENKVQCTINDMTGRVLENTTLKAGINELSVSQWNNGRYIITISTSDGRIISRQPLLIPALIINHTKKNPMNKYFRKAALIAALILPAIARSQDTTKKVSKETMISNLTTLFNQMEEQKTFNGNIMVSLNGEAIFKRSVGFGNLKTKELLTDASVFELASVSKQFTAAGILRLADKKQLKIDQMVTDILPGLPYSGITIRMLFNHTSGLPDYMKLFSEHWDSTKIATNKDLVPMLKKYKPEVLFNPGEKWAYSNTGYALLACIIEKVSGKSYTAFMKEQVFAPLKMNQTFIFSRRFTPKEIPHYALGYVQNDEGKYILPDEVSPYSPVYFLDGIQGDGTVNTTTGDMLKWNNAVINKQFLSASSWKQSLTRVCSKKWRYFGLWFWLDDRLRTKIRACYFPFRWLAGLCNL